MPTNSAEIFVRWIARSDVRDVLTIDRLSFALGISEAELVERLRCTNAIGLVADDGEGPIGYLIYRIEKHAMRIDRVAVHPLCRRQGIGSILVGRVVDKLGRSQRENVTASVPESCVAAQLLFRACGFACDGIVYGDECGQSEDSYAFVRSAWSANRCRPEDAGWVAQCF